MFTWHFNGLDRRTNKPNLKENGCGPCHCSNLSKQWLWQLIFVWWLTFYCLSWDNRVTHLSTFIQQLEENVCQSLLVDTLLTQSHSGLEGISYVMRNRMSYKIVKKIIIQGLTTITHQIKLLPRQLSMLKVREREIK